MTKLFPLPQSKIESLRGIVEARLNESNLTERSSVDDCLAKLDRGYQARHMAAYVDNIQDPKVCLIMCHFPGLATSSMVAHISLIYVSPEQRGDLEVVNTILRTAENYARFHGADTLAGTSWKYRGSKGSDDLWRRNNFEVQETIYVKHLT